MYVPAALPLYSILCTSPPPCAASPNCFSSSFRPNLYLEPTRLELLSSEHSRDSAVFVVKGVTVGNTNLYFNVTLPLGHVVTSNAKEVQVYSPLQLSPTHVWLVTGAVFKVCRGYMLGRGVYTVCVCVCVCVCACVRVCACMYARLCARTHILPLLSPDTQCWWSLTSQCCILCQ